MRADAIADLAAPFGFDLVAIDDAAPLLRDLAHLEAWVSAGCGADLGYMTRRPPERADARTLMRDVATVVVVAVAYPDAVAPFAANGAYGRVARYAWGRDYHDLVLPRLDAFGAALADAVGAVRWRSACDHSPFLERAAAARAGLGFVGKNTCLILPRRGSWWLLGEVLLDVALEPTTPPAPPRDHPCGSCTRCLDRCPTGAFPAPYVLDASRCISYLTIEHRGSIPHALRQGLGAWVFGCDVCQEVCPFNRTVAAAPWPELQREAGVGPDLDLLATLGLREDAAFAARFAGTPLLRPRRAGLLRNAALVARNVGATAAVPVLEEAATADVSSLVREAALWALAGLDRTRARRVAERALRRAEDPLVAEEARLVLDATDEAAP